jgi:hypothetical protein
MGVKFITAQAPAVPLTPAAQVPTAAAYGMITVRPGQSVYAMTTTVPGITEGQLAAYRNIYSGPVIPAGRGRG